MWSVLQSRQGFFRDYGLIPLLCDFLLNVGAILFATTVYSGAPALLNLLLISPAVVLCVLPKKHVSVRHEEPSSQAGKDGGKKAQEPASSSTDLPLRAFLTTYRGAMMVITCVAILAVDFKVFPRRFAKAENWGTSLMDLGVGSFVFSAGVVSARAVLKAKTAGKHRTPFLSRLIRSTLHSFPLIVLGLVRLYSVKGLDYAEHVTEYGVHWNFFFTLALLPPFVETSELLTAWAVPSNEVLSLLIVLLYEVALDNSGLKRYIMVSPRGSDWLSKNREGVFSFIGYFSIFLAGRGTGLRIMPASSPSSKGTKSAAKQEQAWRSRRALLRTLTVVSVVWILIFVVSLHYRGLGLRVSRRLANLPYVLWINAFNTAQLLLFCLIETVCFPEAYLNQFSARICNASSSKLLQAFNKGGLAIFLIANLLTGLVNLTFNTLDMSSLGSMGILILYMTCLAGVALAFDAFNIKLKL